jgi:adhesin transport system outer membrane protein
MTVRPSYTLRLAGVLVATAVALPAVARCIDDEGLEPGVSYGGKPVAGDAGGPRASLQSMVQEAVRRSQSIGAARLLAEAAAADVDETRMSSRPQAGLTGTLGRVGTSAPNTESLSGNQARLGLSISAPLFDGGRITQLTDWRSHLAEAARLGQLSAQEQVALQTVSLALDRSRYRMQAQVYQQYSRKMSCLVEALETIVRADKGRTSELVQAQKNQQQADLQQVQTLSMVRQIEVKLRRFVGDGLPPTEGLSSVLLDVPKLDELLAQADRAAEIAQLDQQAEAADSYARAVVAGQKPQVNWTVGGSKAKGAGDGTNWSAGVSFNIPLYNASNEYSSAAARKRAEAAKLQRADALEGRRFRMSEVHEQATSAFDRAQRVISVLRDSDRVRNFTLQQWQQLGRRSLFDVMAAEGDHYGLRVAYVNALYDGEQANALLRSLGLGIGAWLQ